MEFNWQNPGHPDSECDFATIVNWGSKGEEYGEVDMKEKIIALVEEILQVPAGTVTEDTRMEDVEQWDSLAHVMIIGALDEKLGISVDLEAAIEVTDMAALLALCNEA